MNQFSSRTETPRVITRDEGERFQFGEVSGRFKISGEASHGHLAVAELPDIPPGVLAAPLHRHRNEDEYTYVVAGKAGIIVGDEVVTAEPGMWILKPRGLWHTFWNAGEQHCHVIEIISPAGFERYFREVAEAEGDLERLARVNEKYSVELDFDSLPELCERFNLRFPDMAS